MKVKIFFLMLFVVINLSALLINIPGNQPTIQAGINMAADGDTILVQPGTFVENIDFAGKAITVASLLLTTQDTTYISQTTIDGNSNGNSVVTFDQSEASAAVLTGFTLTNGSNTWAGGVYCSGVSPTLSYLSFQPIMAEKLLDFT